MTIFQRESVRNWVISFLLLMYWKGSALAGVHVVAIGVSHCADESFHDLPFVDKDVERIQRVIELFAGSEVSIVQLQSGNLPAELKPTKSNILSTLEKATSNTDADDVLIFYFSGHGHVADQTVYLVPADGKRDSPAETMVPASAVRDSLASSAARHKIILLDSCHAGAAVSDGRSQPADAEQLARSLEPAAAEDQTVYTMTSCSADEESFPLLQKPSNPSVFTYWLEHALRGNANSNLDDVLDGQEVFEFVKTQVERSSRNFSKQTPRLLTSNNDITRRPVLWGLQPRAFRSVAQDTVKTMTCDLVDSKVRRVGLIPFFQGTTAKEASYSSEFTLVCRQWAADALHEFSMNAENLDLPVSFVGEHSLERTLQELEFRPYHAESTEMIRRLATEEQLDAVISGQILRAEPSEYTFSLVAYSADGVRLSEPVVAKGMVVADQLVLLRSFDARESSKLAKDEALERADEAYGSDITGQLKQKEDRILAEALSKQAVENKHPLEDPAWPFRVSLMINGQESTPIHVGGQCFAPVEEGKAFAVRVENRSNHMVMMRLLVDGFHTLPTLDTNEPLSARHLDDARAWILDPGKQYHISGYVMKLGDGREESSIREFEVVDASISLAQQRKYTKHIGAVTAVFYTARSASRGLGVRPGKQRSVTLEKRRGFVPDRLLGSVHLRYFDPMHGYPSN
jgi:hypothetical protein